MTEDERNEIVISILLFIVILIVVTVGYCNRAEAHKNHDHIPPSAEQYRPILAQEVRFHLGMKEPISRFAAQIHQESRWQSGVCSRFACGLSQFTEATAKDMAKMYPADLQGSAAPLDPAWAIRAMILYMKRLRTNLFPFGGEAHAAALVAYNGGSGWLLRERTQAALEGADPQRWWCNVEHSCVRAEWACAESRQYPRRILFDLWPLYRKGGWQS